MRQGNSAAAVAPVFPSLLPPPPAAGPVSVCT